MGLGLLGVGLLSLKGRILLPRISLLRTLLLRFLGWQDTLYLHYGKQYLKDCYIEGSVEFIFGKRTALLEHCHVHCKSAGFIIAQSKKSSQESTGYVFLSGYALENLWEAEFLIRKYRGCMRYFLEDRIMHSIYWQPHFPY